VRCLRRGAGLRRGLPPARCRRRARSTATTARGSAATPELSTTGPAGPRPPGAHRAEGGGSNFAKKTAPPVVGGAVYLFLWKFSAGRARSVRLLVSAPGPVAARRRYLRR
jgi:hypothetical protein